MSITVLDTDGISVSFLRNPVTAALMSIRSLLRSSRKLSAVSVISVRSSCRTWISQCASSTLRLPAPFACRSPLNKASYPTRLSLPATASRLMSVTHASLAAGLPHASLSIHALRRVEPGVAPICFGRGPVWRHPGRPAQLPKLAETDGFDSGRWNRQFGIPIELGSIVKIDEVRERLAKVAAGQKSNVLSEALGVDADPDLVLNAIDASAQHCLFAKHVMALAQNRIFLRVKHQPRSDELIDFRLDLKQAADGAGETRGGFGLASQQPRKAELGGVGDAVEIPVGFGAAADCGADIGEEAVCRRTIVLCDRARIRPGTKEQLKKAVIEDVKEARESVVVGEDVMIGFLGRRQRQRALGAEQSHIFDKDLQRLVFVVAVFHAGEVRRRKLHERVLPKKNQFVAQRRAFADARLVVMDAFEMPQHGEIVEPPWLGFQLVHEARV